MPFQPSLKINCFIAQNPGNKAKPRDHDPQGTSVPKSTLGTRLDSSEIYNHICSCNEYNFIKNMLEPSPWDEDSNIKCSLTDLIFTNTKIIDKSKHWSLKPFQESIAINRLKLSLNHGTKASKDLLIFN